MTHMTLGSPLPVQPARRSTPSHEAEENPTRHKVVIGDARRLTQVADESAHLVVTSPPYWQLKDYGDKNQIGFNDSYEDYINHLNLVWNECHRVLAPGCRLCVNIGDQFARSVYYGRYKVIPIRTEIIRFCETIGFDCMGTIIWQKAITMNTTGGASVMGSYPYPRNGIVKIDYEYILLFKKLGAPPPVERERKERSRLSKEEWNRYFSGHWRFPGERQDKHLAMFPAELPARLIKMFSFVGDTVLDPFLGSGTTSLSAMNLGRHSIGYEINEKFVGIIRDKLLPAQNKLWQPSVEIVRQEAEDDGPSLRRRIEKLPYVFKDPVRMQRQVDPKKLQFGSKLDDSASKREHFYYVKEVRGANEVILDNDLEIRLLGIKPLKGKSTEMKDFIAQKTRGRKVFIRFDQKKHDDNGKVLCYLYLSDKTFINAHLIKMGLAGVDQSVQHRHFNRFLKYQEKAEDG